MLDRGSGREFPSADTHPLPTSRPTPLPVSSFYTKAVYFGSWNAEHDGGWCGGAGDNGTAQAGPWGLADLEVCTISFPFPGYRTIALGHTPSPPLSVCRMDSGRAARPNPSTRPFFR